MKKIVIGILAHVDSGKTTLSEAMLYISGAIRTLGRVDHGNAFLDTEQQEKDRGITIFSKQAEFSYLDTNFTLLDTPGHVDFSAEMERTLQVIDYAVLVINGMEGVQSHTETLWRLLKRYKVPVFIFVNKMDISSVGEKELMEDIRHRLSDCCVDFCCLKTDDNDKESEANTADILPEEQIAMSDEAMLYHYLEYGYNRQEDIVKAIAQRKLFPCFFGSALKIDGVEKLLAACSNYMKMPEYKKEFAARVFKILRDAQGERLTYMKITGGSLKCRDTVCQGAAANDEKQQPGGEKVNQIRIYSGNKYETVPVAYAGEICAVTGITNSYVGQGLGVEENGLSPGLCPVLTYEIKGPDGVDSFKLWQQLKLVEEEDPMLHIMWNEDSHEIFVMVMGEIQLQVLHQLIKDRFNIEITFGTGQIAYKETIKTPVMGVGHFEPLRHYAEVHLMLEPMPEGTGIVCDTICSEDVLNRNWQRLICTHIMEKAHTGVLTGAPLTDVKITLTVGRAHTKHTEGGDFRQATYRAIRQGLMMAENVLLEPVYSFRLELQANLLGRAMSDITRMNGTFDPPETYGDISVISGTAPVFSMREYNKELLAYSHGKGKLTLLPAGYKPCHNQEEIISDICYNPDTDLNNPSSSVFCAHGAGFIVDWYDVYDYMHITDDKGFELTGQSAYIQNDDAAPVNYAEAKKQMAEKSDHVTYTDKELEDIFVRTYGGHDKKRVSEARRNFHKRKTAQASYENLTAKTGIAAPYAYKNSTNGEEYLLVDGYNIIFAWDELTELAAISLDAARNKLMDILCNYQGYKGCELILVFDAYKVKENPGEKTKYNNIHVVYTKEAETADMYIEKTTHELGRRHKVTVATSDAMEQLIIMGQGAIRMSARGLKEEIERVNLIIRDEYLTE